MSKSSPKRPLLEVLARRWPELNRERILGLILCGDVTLAGQTLRDPKERIDPDADVQVRPPAYVSRGGLKLEAALNAWPISVAGKVVLDVGASTGGFTDALLRYGATRVYSVDVARGFLHPRLRQDTRVVNLEGTNFWDLPILDPPPHGAVMDLSFRSVDDAVPYVLGRVTEGWLICLVKPQFEYRKYGPNLVTFHGVIGDAEGWDTVQALLNHLSERGIRCRGHLPSPVRGRKGNQEYLVWLAWSDHADQPRRGEGEGH